MRNSVSTLLMVLLSVLAAGILVSTAILMSGAAGRYRESVATEQLTAADKAIFQNVLVMRARRGDMECSLHRARQGASVGSQDAQHETGLVRRR